MKYGVDYTAGGEYLHNGRQVVVVKLANSAALSRWIDEKPRRREEISAKKYVVNVHSGRSFNVRAAAISPDATGQDAEVVMVPIGADAEWNDESSDRR